MTTMEQLHIECSALLAASTALERKLEEYEGPDEWSSQRWEALVMVREATARYRTARYNLNALMEPASS